MPITTGFQPAVSRISNPQAPRRASGVPTGSRRYSRLETSCDRQKTERQLSLILWSELQGGTAYLSFLVAAGPE